MRGVGWVVLLAIAAVVVLEHTGRFDRIVTAALRARLGPLADEIEIAEADVRWLDRTLVLRGLAVGEDGRDVVLDHVELRFGWRGAQGLALQRAVAKGGHVRFSRALTTALEGLVGGRQARGEPFDPDTLPSVFAREVGVALETPEGGDLYLGTIDMALRRRAGGVPRLAGRLVPALGEDGRGAGVVWLDGELDDDGVLGVRIGARRLPLRAADLPPGSPLDALAPWAPEAVFELEGSGRYSLGESVLPEGSLRLRVADGTVLLPHLDDPSGAPVRDVDVVAEVAFAPRDAASVWDPRAWSLAASANATWESVRMRAGVRTGDRAPEGVLAEAWVSIPDALLGERLLEVGGRLPDLVALDRQFAPEGRADLTVAARVPSDWTTDEALGRRVERFIAVEPRGEASMAYHGGIHRRTGRRDVGFPLPVHRVTGLVTWSIRPGVARPGQFALVELGGLHAGGPVQVSGSRHFMPRWLLSDPSAASAFPATFDLRVAAEDLAVDEQLERAFDGLSGVRPCGEIFDTWSPAGGELDFELRLWESPALPEMAAAVDLELDGVGVTWRELAVPLAAADGTLVVRSDGGGVDGGGVSIRIDATGRSEAARGPARVRGHVRTSGPGDDVSWFAVEADEVNVRAGVLRGELGRLRPGLVGALENAGAAGFVDVAVDVVRPRARADSRTWTRVHTHGSGGAALQPRHFPLDTTGVHGRVLAAVRAPWRADDAPPDPDASTLEHARATVQGSWRNGDDDLPVVASVTARHGERPRLEVAGAGLDLRNRALLGSLTELAEAADDGGDPFDTDKVQLEGRVDFAAGIDLPAEPGDEPGPLEVTAEARLERLVVRGRQLLGEVAAHVRLEPESKTWIGERIEAELGTTPVHLHEVRWSPTARGSRLDARLSSESIPVDREHLRHFVDADTLARLVDDLGARGRFAVRDGRLTLELLDDGSSRLDFDGRLGIEELAVRLGLPLDVRAVDDVDVAFALEGDRFRAHAEVEGLFGRLAGRRLEDAALLVSYVEPRLSIEAFDGRLEGGRLRALGSDDAPAATFFSLDLVPPFPFRLAAEMIDVDVGEFLRGVFDSDFANRGRMDLRVELDGAVDRLTAVGGGGRVEIRDSALWAVPVFQALFSRLGLDTTALFRSMWADFRIEDGALLLDRMRIDSDILSVVGDGSIDFEGDLTSDLEVRYGLVDRLGPFRRLLYRIQNSLLRVSIRGTMERPVVVPRGFFSQFFAPSDERDRLPLPGFSELPERF